MLIKVFRYTPGRTLTYNNRWYPFVSPKQHLFFIPPTEEQLRLWLDFLCTRQRRPYLYLHAIRLIATRYKTRVLTMWKGEPLLEVMVRERDYVKRFFVRTQRVTWKQKALPSITKGFLPIRRLPQKKRKP